MKHQLKEGMAAKCANAQELISAINAIKAAGLCPSFENTDGTDSDDFPHIWFYDGKLDQCRGLMISKWTPLHEFILRALGQWVEEPKELTLEVAKELLKESISHVLNNDCVGQRKWAAKLAEYGIKP